MTKKSLSLMLLLLLMASVVSACQTTQLQETQQARPSPTLGDIVGIWSGKAQWMCGRGDPPWIITMEFKPDGSSAMMMTDPNGVTAEANGTWSLSGNNTEIKLSTNVWSGIVSNDKMEGTFKDDRDPCVGNWSVTKN